MKSTKVVHLPLARYSEVRLRTHRCVDTHLGERPTAVVDQICAESEHGIALLVKPLEVKIADRRYVNACKNTDSEDIERIFRL